jgi:hypothetical protein
MAARRLLRISAAAVSCAFSLLVAHAASAVQRDPSQSGENAEGEIPGRRLSGERPGDGGRVPIQSRSR